MEIDSDKIAGKTIIRSGTLEELMEMEIEDMKKVFQEAKEKYPNKINSFSIIKLR